MLVMVVLKDKTLAPSANLKNEVAGKELQESLTTSVWRWRGQQVQPHILDESHAAVDQIYTSKSSTQHYKRESSDVEAGRIPMGPEIENFHEVRWRGQQVQPQNMGTVATIHTRNFDRVAGVPIQDYLRRPRGAATWLKTATRLKTATWRKIATRLKTATWLKTAMRLKTATRLKTGTLVRTVAHSSNIPPTWPNLGQLGLQIIDF